jgi:hypothetical protein
VIVDLDTLPFWSPADAAELTLLACAWVDAVYEHKAGRCSVCAEPGLELCRPVEEALEGIVAWRDRRALLSRAIYLRARQDLDEAPLWAAARTELQQIERERQGLVA